MNQLSQFVVHHWPLCVAFFVLLFIIVLNELMTYKTKATEITPQKAIDLINNEGAVIIDLREKEAFKKGHIIDSINAVAADFSQPKMSQYKDKHLILVCAKGQQAASVATTIRPLGFKPSVLRGGFAAWQNDDLPLVKK